MFDTTARCFPTFPLAIFGLLTGAMLAGCDDGTDTDTDGDSDSDSSGAIVWDTVTQNIAGLTVADVEVCTEMGCGISDDDGEVSVLLPSGESRLAVSLGALEMHQFITVVDTPPQPERILVVTQGLVDLVLADIPDVDPTLGMVLVGNVFDAGHSNAIDVDADGPYYIVPTVTGVDLDATATTTSGMAVFVNVALGEAEITYTPPAGRACLDTMWSQTGSAANSSSVVVSAGVLSVTDMDCRE